MGHNFLRGPHISHYSIITCLTVAYRPTNCCRW